MLPADAEVEGVAPRDLAQRIMALDGIDGVTFTGGEPFLQSAGLAALAALLGERGLSVVTFTGYTLEQLRLSQDPDQQMLLARTDLLVDGPYVEALRDRLPLRGSTNQRLHYLSGRLGPADLDGLPLAEAELCIDARGDIALSGFPDEELLSLIRSAGAPR